MSTAEVCTVNRWRRERLGDEIAIVPWFNPGHELLFVTACSDSVDVWVENQDLPDFLRTHVTCLTYCENALHLRTAASVNLEPLLDLAGSSRLVALEQFYNRRYSETRDSTSSAGSMGMRLGWRVRPGSDSVWTRTIDSLLNGVTSDARQLAVSCTRRVLHEGRRLFQVISQECANRQVPEAGLAGNSIDVRAALTQAGRETIELPLDADGRERVLAYANSLRDIRYRGEAPWGEVASITKADGAPFLPTSDLSDGMTPDRLLDLVDWNRELNNLAWEYRHRQIRGLLSQNEHTLRLPSRLLPAVERCPVPAEVLALGIEAPDRYEGMVVSFPNLRLRALAAVLPAESQFARQMRDAVPTLRCLAETLSRQCSLPLSDMVLAVPLILEGLVLRLSPETVRQWLLMKLHNRTLFSHVTSCVPERVGSAGPFDLVSLENLMHTVAELYPELRWDVGLEAIDRVANFFRLTVPETRERLGNEFSAIRFRQSLLGHADLRYARQCLQRLSNASRRLSTDPNSPEAWFSNPPHLSSKGEHRPTVNELEKRSDWYWQLFGSQVNNILRPMPVTVGLRTALSPHLHLIDDLLREAVYVLARATCTPVVCYQNEIFVLAPVGRQELIRSQVQAYLSPLLRGVPIDIALTRPARHDVRDH